MKRRLLSIMVFMFLIGYIAYRGYDLGEDAMAGAYLDKKRITGDWAEGSCKDVTDPAENRVSYLKPGRRYPHTSSVGELIGFVACGDVGRNENPENSVPEELIEALSTALQNDTLEDYAAEISAEYVLLQEDDVLRYIRRDTSGLLESFQHEYIKGGEEWFLFERDNDIIVRQKIDNEEYPYCYYKFPHEGETYGWGLRAYGKNEDYYFISWEDDDYLLVTKRAGGQVNGIAVYQMYGYALIGWILGLEKTSDGEIEVTFYTYTSSGSGVQGTRYLDY